MPNQVPVQVASERNRILRELAAEKKLAFMQSFVGKALEAITLNVVHSGSAREFSEALTDNYQKLYLRGSHAPNRWITACIEGIEGGVLAGGAIPANSAVEFVSS
jgi:tRNA A37 methylthiotransferase MiaB